MHMHDFKNIRFLYIAIFLLFITTLFSAYPGGMTIDSYTIFRQSLSGQYTIPFSPIIAVTWHYLNFIHTGPFVMLCVSHLMLWGSVVIFVYVWHKQNGYNYAIWFFVLVPFLPSLIKPSGYIWKDVLFAFAYLLSSAFISCYSLQKKNPNLLIKIFIFILLCFGTACKYQAIYILPIFIFWYSFRCWNFSKSAAFCVAIILSLCVNQGIHSLNNSLANDYTENTRTGWQEIKFFDLVYISLKTNQILLPEYVQKDKRLNFEQFQGNFKSSTIFKVMFGKRSPITFTENPEEQRAIKEAWNNAVLHHPFAYLQGRLYRISRLLTRFVDRMPSMLYYDNLVYTGMDGYYNKAITHNFLSRYLELYIKVFFWASMFALCLPFSIYYLYSGLKSYLNHNSEYGFIAFIMNLAALCMVCVMTFVAVNIDFRYLFICHVMFHFSHPFAWVAIKLNKQNL
jgi:hypothetical protein